jgi:hypothetical protein
MLRKLKWQLPGEPLAARYNWYQGPVPGRGPAVEKHWPYQSLCWYYCCVSLACTPTQYTRDQHNSKINKAILYAATDTYWLHERLQHRKYFAVIPKENPTRCNNVPKFYFIFIWNKILILYCILLDFLWELFYDARIHEHQNFIVFYFKDESILKIVIIL